VIRIKAKKRTTDFDFIMLRFCNYRFKTNV
jgi:hypothetical protein